MNQVYIELIRRLTPAALLIAALGLAAPLRAQAGDDGRATQAGRSELEAQAAEAERAAQSASDPRERERRMTEAAMLRQRLREGDFQVGDRIVLTLPSADTAQSTRSDTLRVGAGRVVTVPHVGDVPLHGVLRSELQDYMRRQLARVFRDPDVRATALIRVAVFGPVARPGFYDVPADVRVSDAIMIAGGPGHNARLDRTAVRRGTQVLLGPNTVQNAIRSGATLDQLNLRAGDEIVVGEKQPTKWSKIAQVAGVVTSLALTVYWLAR